MAYFTTTTSGGTVRFHDEAELTMGVAPIAPVTPDIVTSPSTLNLRGNDYDLERIPEPQEYIPSRTELLQRHEIVIQFMSVGCVIRIGCKSIPFESVDQAMKELNEYVNNPRKSTKKWEKVFGK